jgi:thiol-disulfide isomerase/thioredoxin
MIQDEELFKYKKKNGKWGWLNSNGQIAIQPDFIEAMSFGNRDTAPAAQDSLWGYINKEGKYVINPQFKLAYPFMNSRAFVKFADDNLATIDKNGKKDLQTEYQKIDPSYWETINFGVATELRIMTAKPGSFNCNKLSNEEKTADRIICKSFNLIDMDYKMNELYIERKKDAGEGLAKSNKAFLERRNACKDANCLERAYEERIEELTNSNFSATPSEKLPLPAELQEELPWFALDAKDDEDSYNGLINNSELKELARQKGSKKIVISFFATWCEPCREGLRLMSENSGELQKKGVLVLLVNAGESDYSSVDAWVKKYAKKQWLIGFDKFNNLPKLFGLSKTGSGEAPMPRTLITDANLQPLTLIGKEGDDFPQILWE